MLVGWSPKCQLWSAYGVIPPCGYTWASVALHGPGSPASLVTPSHFCCFLLSLACIYSTSFCLPQKPVTSTTSPCLWFPDLYLELKPFPELSPTGLTTAGRSHRLSHRTSTQHAETEFVSIPHGSRSPSADPHSVEGVPRLPFSFILTLQF